MACVTLHIDSVFPEFINNYILWPYGCILWSDTNLSDQIQPAQRYKHNCTSLIVTKSLLIIYSTQYNAADRYP